MVAEGGGQVDRPRPAEHADGEVRRQASHSGRYRADLGAVLGEGDVAKVMQRLDRPMPRIKSARRAALAWTWVSW